MGAKHSKTNALITDYSRVKIPKDYTLIKIGTYNVNLKNTINVDYKIKEITSYITNNYKKKSLDIINLQGFSDTYSLYVLIRELKQYYAKHKQKIYFGPKFDNIEQSSSASNNTIPTPRTMIDMSFHSSGFGCGGNYGNYGNSNENINKKLVQNIIISKYPIVSTIYSELDDKTDMDDILGIQSVIGANILIGNTIISIYNTCLSKDIKTANIINSSVRTTELDTLIEIIETNKNKLKTNFTKYNNSDVHLIVGSIHINETDKEGVSKEYVDLVTNKKCIDIFRYLHSTDPGYTTAYKERMNYIFLNLTDDIYDKNEIICETFKGIKSSDQLFDLIFKRYSIYFLDNYVINHINNNTVMYYPVECIFFIKSK